MAEQIFECIVCTADRSGRPHLAPMGVRYRDGGRVLLMPFKPRSEEHTSELQSQSTIRMPSSA